MRTMRTRTRHSVALSVALLVTAVSGPAWSGGPLPEMASRLDAPGRSTASEDGADALVLNPANLAFIPGGEIRWTGVLCPDTQKVNCGQSLEAAAPLPFGLATGLRLDYLDPPRRLRVPLQRVLVRVGHVGPRVQGERPFSIGASLQHSYSSNPYVERPLGGHDRRVLPAQHTLRLLARRAGLERPAASRSSRRPPARATPSSTAATPSPQPSGPRGGADFELGLDVKCQDLGAGDQCITGGGLFEPRVDARLRHPGRRARARGRHSRPPRQRRAARLSLGRQGSSSCSDASSFGGGALFGNGLGTRRPRRVRDRGVLLVRGPGFSMPCGTPCRSGIETDAGRPRAHALLRKLWQHRRRPQTSPRSRSILRAEPADSYAHAEELADAIRVLRARKKKVLCSWEDAGARTLYVCANADRIVVNPAGGLRYAGLRMQYMYLGRLLEKLGVRAEFVRVSEHKSAPEQFTNEHASDVARLTTKTCSASSRRSSTGTWP